MPTVARSWYKREFLSLMAVIWYWLCTYALWLFAMLAVLGYEKTSIVGLLVFGVCNTPNDNEEKVPTRGTEETDSDSPDRKLRRLGSFSYDLSGRNAPRPVSYFVNNRSRKIYYRVMLPSDGAPTCLVFLIHGYSAHFNRPTYIPFLKELMDKRVAVATVDLEGHGYSEGMRCFLPSIDAILDDLEQLVDLVQSGHAIVSPSDPYSLIENAHAASPEEQAKADMVAKLPFFVGGQSLGGALALLLSQRLNTRRRSYATWRGAILLCPALAGNKPPAPVTAFLRYCVAPLFPRRRMPDFLDSTADNSVIWKSETLIEWHISKDVIGKPGGLGYGASMRWGTAAALLDMIDEIEVLMREVTFPLLVLHDPADKIVPYAGSERLKELAPSRDKTFIEMHNKLHDMICNCPSELARFIVPWAKERAHKKKEN